MNKIGNMICKRKNLIIILSLILLIPSLIGMFKTKINYDILVYLPEDIETIKGEKILTEDFNMGAFAIAVIENIPDKNILSLEEKIRDIDGVNKVASILDITGTAIPLEIIPSEIKDKVAKDNSRLMIITFNESTSDDKTLEAVETIKSYLNEESKIGGMSSMVLDTKELFNSEMTLYIVIAVILCIVVLTISLDSFIVPLLLIINIGYAILLNMGSNIFLGDISYITKAISSILQLGVTTDFSIFLYHKYEKAKKENKDKNKAMGIAIGETLVSVLGSSLTTIAGFLALCTMQLTLGTDIGIVMAKGVIFGLICVVTLFPALLLVFDKQIEKTKHKAFLPKFKGLKNFIIKRYKLIFVIFIVLLIPAYIAQTKTKVYYKLDESIPDDYNYSITTKKLKENYNIVSQQIILVNKTIPNSSINKMVSEIEKIDGVSLVLNPSSLASFGIDESILNDDIKNIYQTDKYKLVLINSSYDIATEDLNNQIAKINDIVKSYDKDSILAGEGPLMKDLVEITDQDFKNVNITSIAVIFVIMILVLRSVSLPVLLVSAIEFAIFINMGIPYFTNTEIPFIASVVLGTIQLGATIDYAILMTTKYLEKRKNGKSKEESVRSALDNSMNSIIVSGFCFFAATIGVGIVSQIDMIGTLCTLISRGAIISMLVVILVVPSLLMIFDKIICKTTLGFKNKKENKNMKAKKIIKKVSVYTLILMMTLSTLPVKALTKEETVYSKLDETGTPTYTIVTEHLINDENLDTIVDKTDLKDITNTNGDETFKLDNSTLTWEANKNDIYYNGKTDKELPIKLDVSYKLNGETKEVKDILGKSGNVEITLTYKNTDKHIVKVNGKNTTLYTPFVVTTGTILDSKTTSNVKVTNGKIISNGNSYVIAAIAAPGLYESLNVSSLKDINKITISYDTTNFELNSIYSLVSAKLIDSNDLKIFDKLDSLYSKADTLKESSTKLVNGSKALTSGTKQIRDAVKKSISDLKNNNETLDEQTILYIKNSAKEAAIENVKSQEQNIKQEAIQKLINLEQSTHSIKNASDYGVENNSQLIAALKLAAHENLKQTIGENDYNACLSVNCSAISQAETQAIESAKTQFYNNALELAKQTTAQTAYNTALEVAEETASKTSSQVATNVASQVKSTIINKMVTSLNTLVGGLDELVSGAETLSNGMDKFDKEGINSISSLVNSIKPTSKKIKALSKLADDYKTFAGNGKNVNCNSKFILIIDGKKAQ